MTTKYLVASLITIALLGCDNPRSNENPGSYENPGGITDADYEKYKRLGAPKILYQCTRYRRRGGDGLIAFPNRMPVIHLNAWRIQRVQTLMN